MELLYLLCFSWLGCRTVFTHVGTQTLLSAFGLLQSAFQILSVHSSGLNMSSFLRVVNCTEWLALTLLYKHTHRKCTIGQLGILSSYSKKNAFETCELTCFVITSLDIFQYNMLFYRYLFLYSVIESQLSCWYRDEDPINYHESFCLGIHQSIYRFMNQQTFRVWMSLSNCWLILNKWSHQKVINTTDFIKCLLIDIWNLQIIWGFK